MEASHKCGLDFTINSARCWMCGKQSIGTKPGPQAQSLCLFFMAVGLAKHSGTAQLNLVLQHWLPPSIQTSFDVLVVHH